MRILLIDDDPDIRLLAGFVLEAAGHQLVTAESAQEGLDHAAQADFDVVLLDYRLGDMTGDLVLGRLLAERADRAVIMLTGTDDPAAAAAFAAQGALGVIGKPFDPETLEARVSDICRSARRDR